MLVVLLKKTDYNTKITEIENKLNNHNHDKYIDTSEFNKLAADVFNARLAQANLITKTNFDAKLSSLNRKTTANKSKNLLVENELNKLKTFDSSYFIGKSHFEENGTQNYLVFQPINRCFKLFTNTDYFSSWKSKGRFPLVELIRAKRIFSREFFRTKTFLIFTKQKVRAFIFFNNADNFVEKKWLLIIYQKF